MDKLYHYRAHVKSVYDGDTATIDFDLGLKTWIKKERVRLSRINATEVRGKEKVKGKLSRDFLKSIILDKEIIVKTMKDKKEKIDNKSNATAFFKRLSKKLFTLVSS